MQLVSGGFFVTRFLRRPDGLGEAPLPDRILTLSPCLTEFLPEAWAIGWASCSDADRVAAGEKLGLAAAAIPAFLRSMTDALARGDLGWPCVWQSFAAAQAAVAQWGGSPTEFLVLELGVPGDVAEELLVELAPRSGEGETGLYSRLKANAPLHDAGVPIGWELLGIEASDSFHSWLCNSLHRDAANRLGIRPGAFGLLSTEADARAVLGLIEDGLGAEPVPWFVGLLSRLT
jgi:hypothetical protein